MKAFKNLLNRKYYKNMTQTFTPSGAFQEFVVPATTTKLSVECVASKGCDRAIQGGNGGKVECILPVTPSSTLYFMVGDIPSSPTVATYNASDIRTDNTGILDSTSLSSRLVVAGGGGSPSNTPNFTPGLGGGLNGGDAQNADSNIRGGKGGTQSGGGYQNGSFGLGGTPTNTDGGAGGAGWYGGGASRQTYSAGGGGSSYTDSSCYGVTHTQGANAGQGYITIKYVVEGTSSDYDFYRDTAEYKVVKKTSGGVDTYSALKSWEKGQYYV